MLVRVLFAPSHLGRNCYQASATLPRYESLFTADAFQVGEIVTRSLGTCNTEELLDGIEDSPG